MQLVHDPLNTLGFAAFSGTGKTTLLKAVIPLLKREGLKLGVVKHAHHDFEIDHPGKDSYELRKAGADALLVASRHRWAMMVETPDRGEPPLDELLEQLGPNNFDLILVEGFKTGRFPKIELHRPSRKRPLLFPRDDSIIAIATDAQIEVATNLPLLDLNQPQQVAQFILQFGLNPAKPP